MTKVAASLVFIINDFGEQRGQITVNLQRGDALKRVGPFVGQKAENQLIGLLPVNERNLLEYLLQHGLISGRCIDHRFKLLPDVASAIASFKNLYVRSQRYGSIRRALPKDRAKFTALATEHSAILPGRLLGGELEICDDASVRLSWKYEGLKESIPFGGLETRGKAAFKTDHGQQIIRDVLAETRILNELSETLALPLTKVTEGDFSGADVSKLVLLEKKRWTVNYKGKPATLASAEFGKSGILWFDDDGISDSLKSIDYDRVIEAYLAGRRHLEASGKLVLLPTDCENLPEDIALKAITAGRPEVPFTTIAGIKKDFDDKEKSSLKQCLVNTGFKAELKDYQLDGVLWLSSLSNARLGGILADEMGLGKTVQTLAYLFYKKQKITLIVAPASVIPNWKSEILRFFPEAPIILDNLVEHDPLDSQLIYIVSYQRALKSARALQAMHFDIVILDEGQFVKNAETKTASTLRRSTSLFRLVLSGTPIENSVKDLWAHLTFTNPFLEGSYRRLLRRFPDFGKNKAAAELSGKAFRSLMLRRTKTDVELDLPPMVERIIYCEMTDAQREVYQSTLMAFRKMIKSGVAARVSSIALEALLRLRQCCSLPLLLPSSLNPNLVSDSIKIDKAIDIIDTDISSQRKVIVFSQFRMVLDNLEMILKLRGIGVARLDGSTANRLSPVKQFQEDPSVQVFIIGFRAGGFGLNLTIAESVILFDPWWNPAAESQAFARAHRIGQTKSVFVSKLICSNTIEDKMLDLAAQKRTLVNSFSDVLSGITTEELMQLIVEV